MAVKWRVKFCSDCFHAFDVPVTGLRTSDICDECKGERRRQNNRRSAQNRQVKRHAARAA